MDNAASVAKKNGLTIGKALTKEQIAKLDKDNENELIREYAIKELNRHDFIDKDVEEQD